MEWLQHNNPLYCDIVISPERLSALPVDAIPDEIINLMRSSDDIKTLIEESESYIPDDIPNDEGKISYWLYVLS